ncbi:GTP-binding protein 8 isoform X1 [Dendropsophus ebraccatus]|uniref:GTP-binding protein 8 isoform X1 n=1 Tax=Dendropsophus ebraccatus TaxID=150705 RepID=UPI0038322E64
MYIAVLCPSCRPKDNEEPNLRDVIIWVKDFVQKSIENSQDSHCSRHSKRAKRSFSPSVSHPGSEFKIIDEVGSSSASDSSSSPDEKETVKGYFPMDRINKLLKAVQAEIHPEELEDGASTSKKPRAFSVGETSRAMLQAEWKRPEKAPVLSKKFKTIYVLKEDQSKDWIAPPKVDTAVAKLSKRTILPAEDGSNLKDPMDRRIEIALKRAYSAASAQGAVSISSYEVSRSLRRWLAKVQEDLEAGVDRDKILGSFKKMNMAIDFLCDAASQETRLASRTMALTTAGRRALWLRPWFGDNASKFQLCNLEYQPGRLFGPELDKLMEDLSDKKGKSLPLTSKFCQPFRRGKSPQREKGRYQTRGRGSNYNRRGNNKQSKDTSKKPDF